MVSLRRARAGLHVVFVMTTVFAMMAALLPTTSSAASASATLSQCTNGMVSPLTLEQCAGATGGGSVSILNGTPGSGYSNWVSGNSQGSKSHWRENEFIPYRAQIFDTAGSHTIQLHYDTVHSGGHALDYLGSYDATESTSTSCSQTAVDGSFVATPGPTCPAPPGFHANYDNPCADLAAPGIITSGCAFDGTQVVAAGSKAIPAADVTSPTAQNCGGSGSTGAVAGGTFSQISGSFKIFGPSGSSVTGVSYVSQNVPGGTGQCSTTVQVSFTIGGSGSQTVVLAWGGHIASRADWGLGNSASAISGSPYHMALDNLDNGAVNLGSQDRALATSAVFFTPSITTSIDGNNTTSISAGGSVFDTATLANAEVNAGGTVTYNFFKNGTCAGTPSTTQNVTVSAAVVPNSASTGALTAGSYSFDAVYGGDANDIGYPQNAAALSPCEPFTVLAPAVSVIKTTTTPNVLAGSPISYTLTVENAGPGTATNVVATDTLPTNAGLNWSITSQSPSNSCAIASGVLTCSYASLAPTNPPVGSSATPAPTVTIGSPTSLATCGTVNNSATVTSGNDGGNTTGAISITVTCPNPALHKQERDVTTNGSFSDGPITVNPGDVIEYQLAYKNNGSGAATGVTISDTIPANTTFVSCSNSCNNTAGVLTWNEGTVAAGASATETFRVSVPTTFAGNVYSTSNFATSRDQTGTTTSNTVVANATFGPTSSLHKQERDATTNGSFSDGPIAVNPGDTIEYQIVYKNTGFGPALGVTITDTVPANTSFVSCSNTCGNAGGVLSWSEGDIAAGGTATESFQVTVPVTFGSGTLQISNVASENDQSGGHQSNTVLANVSYPPNSSLHKQERDVTTGGSFSDGPITVQPGDTIEYQLTYKNTGSGPAIGVTITDTLPANTSFVGCSNGCANAAGVLTWTEGTIASGGVVTETFQVTVPSTFTDNSYSTSNVAVEHDQSGDHPSNIVVANATFQPNSSLQKQERDVTTNGSFSTGPITVQPGDTIEYQLVYTNAGPGPAIGVTINDTIPANTSFVGCSNGCSNTAGTLSWTVGTVQAGQSATVTFQVKVPAVFTSNQFTAINVADETDQSGDHESNTVVAFATYQPGSTLHKQERDVTAGGSFSDGPITVQPGDTIEYQLVYTNAGPGPALNVTISDSIPANTAFVSCSNGCSNVAGVLSWNEGTIQATGTVTESFQVTVPTTFATNSYATTNFAVENDQSGDHRSNTVEADASYLPSSSLHKQERDVTAGGTFSDGPITVKPGDVIEYQLTYHNSGSGPAVGVTITDSVPANTSFVGCSNLCTNTAGVLSWNEGTILAGGSATETFQVSVPTTFATNSYVTTNFAVETDQSGDHQSNTVEADATFSPNSSLHKQERDVTTGGSFSDGPITVQPGDVIEYRLAYTNSGSGPALGVTISDSLPANTSFVGCSNTCSNIAGVLSWNEGPIPAGGTATETFQVQVPAIFTTNDFSTTNAACVTDQTGSVCSNTVVVMANFPPNSSLHKQERDATTNGSFSDGPITVNPGDLIEYRLVYTNTGTGPALGVTITDIVPANTAFVGCSNGCSNIAGVLSWSEGDIAAGGTATETFEVQVPTSFATNDYSASNTAVENDQTGDHSSNTVVANAAFPPSSSLHKQERDVTTGGSFSNGPITVNPGDVIEYQLAYTNSGSGPALGVVISDNIPTNTTFVTCSNGCSNIAGVLSWNEGPIAAGGTATETFQVQVPATFATNAYSTTNAACVSDQSGPTCSNTVIVTGNFPPSSSLHKQERDVTTGGSFSEGPITVNPGDTIEYQLTYANAGPGPAVGVVITDTVPANTTFLSCSNTCGNSAGVLSWNEGTILAGGSAVETFQVQVPATFDNNSYATSNAACVADQTGSVCSNTVTATGSFPPSSSLQKQERDVTTGGSFSAGPITVNPGDTIEYQLTYHNAGPGPAIGVTITDTVPANTSFLSCSNTCANNAGVLSWGEGTVQAGGTTIETFQVQVPGTFATNAYSTSNAACVSDQSESTCSNTVVANGNFPPSSSLHKQQRDVTSGGTFTDSPITVQPGDTVEYQLVYKNSGTGPALNVTVTDSVPANTTFVVCSNSCNNSAGVLTWSLGNVPAGNSVTVTFQVKVPATFATNSYSTTNAACATDQIGQTCSNTVVVTGNFPPSSSLHKQERDVTTGGAFSDGPITVNPGDTIEYQLVYSNTGAGPALGVTITDTVPANTTFVSCSNLCNNTGGVLSWSAGDVSAGGTVTETFRVTVPATFTSNTYSTSNVASESDQSGSHSSNTVVANGSYPGGASLHKQEKDVTTGGSYSDGPITASQGDVIQYQLVYTNTGTGPVTNLKISDAIPANTAFVTGSCTPACGNTSGTLSWTFASVPAGGAVTVTFQVTINSGLPNGTTKILNTGQSSSDQVPGPTSSNTVEADVVISIVSQITPTQTTCNQFASGTSATLSSLQYGAKSGTINNVSPGVMFYWVKVTVTSTGAKTYTITQTISGGTSRYFQPASGSFAYDASCNVLGTTVTQSGGTTTVKFTATKAGTYYIGIKYSPSSVVGETVPSPLPTFTYTFATTGVTGSSSKVTLGPKTA